MIYRLDLTKDTIAERLLDIQHRAYRIEADLIGFDGTPPLRETLDDLRRSAETFISYFVDDVLAGVLSYMIIDSTLDIGRLVVHPDYFRRGIGKALVEYVETIEGIDKIIVSTAALNTPARQLYVRQGYHLVEEVQLMEGLTIARYENC